MLTSFYLSSGRALCLFTADCFRIVCINLANMHIDSSGYPLDIDTMK